MRSTFFHNGIDADFEGAFTGEGGLALLALIYPLCISESSNPTTVKPLIKVFI